MAAKVSTPAGAGATASGDTTSGRVKVTTPLGAAQPSGPVEPQPIAAMDYPEHESTYVGFTLLVEVGTIMVINIISVLTLAGINGAFGWAGIGLVLTLAAAAFGWARPALAWRPGVIASGVLGLLILLTS